MNHRKKLIVFEGIDGSGKTTQAKRMHNKLVSRGVDAEYFREPGSSALGLAVREIVYQKGNTTRANTFLFLAARAQLIHDLVLPALERGATVILDRYGLSTMCYQGAKAISEGDAYLVNMLEDLNTIATGGLIAHRTFWLDLPLDKAVERLSVRGGTDVFEAPGYLSNVFDMYRALAPSHANTVRIDADRDEEVIHKELCVEIQQMINPKS